MHVKTILHSWKEVVFPVVNLKSAFNKKRKDTLYLNLMLPSVSKAPLMCI